LDDVETWLEADEDDPGFQILTAEEEVGDTIQPTIKVSEVKDHLNFVIQYVEQLANENVFAYYEHLRHLRQLLTEEISSKHIFSNQ
jgi:hypothetical protein